MCSREAKTCVERRKRSCVYSLPVGVKRCADLEWHVCALSKQRFRHVVMHKHIVGCYGADAQARQSSPEF